MNILLIIYGVLVVCVVVTVFRLLWDVRQNEQEDRAVELGKLDEQIDAYMEGVEERATSGKKREKE